MTSFEACAALCGLDADQIAAVAEHEHESEVEAAAIADRFLRQSEGKPEIRDMFVDLVRNAVRQGRLAHAAELLVAFGHVLDAESLGEAA